MAIARALAAEPELLLLDEPMAAMDIHAVPAMRRLLAEVLAERSAIIITHDVLVALLLADQVAIIDAGRIIEAGPTRQVLSRPRSAFAASLAGLNLLEGTATAGGIDTADGHFAGTSTAVPGQRATAVFPPEAVMLSAAGPGRQAVITDIEPHGSSFRVRAGALAALLTAAQLAELQLAPGDTAWFSVDPAAVQIY